MKKYLAAAFVFLLVFFISYMVGAFAAASFDITQWDAFGRTMCGIMGAFIGGILASMVLTFED
jgi:uncharacterized membrane protein YeaQ/YmgE (transglycosylase-associated protein family)